METIKQLIKVASLKGSRFEGELFVSKKYIVATNGFFAVYIDNNNHQLGEGTYNDLLQKTKDSNKKIDEVIDSIVHTSHNNLIYFGK